VLNIFDQITVINNPSAAPKTAPKYLAIMRAYPLSQLLKRDSCNKLLLIKQSDTNPAQ
jgi:hypothetical protein